VKTLLIPQLDLKSTAKQRERVGTGKRKVILKCGGLGIRLYLRSSGRKKEGREQRGVAEKRNH